MKERNKEERETKVRPDDALVDAVQDIDSSSASSSKACETTLGASSQSVAKENIDTINQTKVDRRKKVRRNTENLVLVALFAALIAVGAFIKIPIPVVPFTLQYLFTMLAGLLLGGRLGALSVLVYIAVGLAGVPVFAAGGGIAYVLQPSFGYLIGFAAGAWLTGYIANRVDQPSYKRLFLASFLGLLVVYLFGMVYYYMICAFYLKNPIGLWTLVLNCFLLAVPGDIILCIGGTLMSKRLIPFLKNRRRG